jgi:hypothetical protein
MLVLLLRVVPKSHVSVPQNRIVILNILTYFWEQSYSTEANSRLSAEEVSLLL